MTCHTDMGSSDIGVYARLIGKGHKIAVDFWTEDNAIRAFRDAHRTEDWELMRTLVTLTMYTERRESGESDICAACAKAIPEEVDVLIVVSAPDKPESPTMVGGLCDACCEKGLAWVSNTLGRKIKQARKEKKSK